MTTIPQPEADQLSNPDNDKAPGTSPGEHATGGVAGKLLWVDLSEKRSWEEVVPPEVSRAFLGGYGLGAWALYRNLEPGTDPLSADNIFGIVAGTLTGYGTPFSGRSQIVSRSPLTGTWADSNSGGAIAGQLKRCGYDGLFVRGCAEQPTALIIRDGKVSFEDATDLWGLTTFEATDRLAERLDREKTGFSVIGPAGEKQSLIAAVINDRYHAWGRQGFGAILGSKKLKAIAVQGSGQVPLAHPAAFKALCEEINLPYREAHSLLVRFMAYVMKTNRFMGFLYRMITKLGLKLPVGGNQAPMIRTWRKMGTTSAVSVSTENGDAPVKNWTGAGSKDFPLSTKAYKVSDEAVQRYLDRSLSCGDCPLVCKGVVSVKNGNYKTDQVRRPDYETLCGFGANMLNDNLESVVMCHHICNNYGMDAVSAAATLGMVAELYEKGVLTIDDLDGIDLKWGNAEAIVEMTRRMATREGCGDLFADGCAKAAERLGSDAAREAAVHVHGQEPAYHDPKFSMSMGTGYVSDPTPGRHTTGNASWNESFGMKLPLPDAKPATIEAATVGLRSYEGKGEAQRIWSNHHQALNGSGLCMFSLLTGGLPYSRLINAATGWDMTDDEFLEAGERIQNMRHAFNVREGIKPADFKAHPRMTGEVPLKHGPLAGVKVDQQKLKDMYFDAMDWDRKSGRVSADRAKALGIDETLADLVG